MVWGAVASIGASVLGSALSKKSGKSTTAGNSGSSQATRLPYAPTIPVLDRLAGRAYNLSGKRGKLDYYGGYTGLDDLQLQGLQQQRGFADTAGSSVVNPAMESWRGALNPAENPYMTRAMSGLADQFTQDMNLGVLPGLRTSATMAGHEGGSTRKNLTEGVATGLGLQGLARAQADMGYRGYQDALQSRDFALGMAPEMLALGQAPGNIMQNIGAQYRADAEGRRLEEQQRNEFIQDAPYEQTRRVLGLTMPIAGLGGTSTSSFNGTNTQPGQPGMDPLQAGLGFGSLVGSFFGNRPGSTAVPGQVPLASAANPPFSVSQQMGFLAPFLRN